MAIVSFDLHAGLIRMGRLIPSGELFRSIYVALRHPLLGIGMGNYQPNMSYNGLVTHNSYTQVASEMG
jgi:hypothetical protein